MKYHNITIKQNTNCLTWYARYRKNGKQHYVSAKTQKDCYNKLKLILKENNNIKTKEKTKQQKTTLKEWFNKWKILYKQNVKINTIKDYDKSFKYLKTIGDININEIKTINILEILNAIQFERRKQAVYDLLKNLLDKAVINEIIEKNPIKNIEKPKHKKINGIAISNEDEPKMIAILKEKRLDIYLICLYQGLRRGEALALTYKDFDLNNKTLTINKAINQYNKIDTTKNINSNRIMPLFDSTIKIIEKYKNTKDRLFTITYGSMQKQFKNIAKKFNNNYTIHSLRHTFITKCQEANIPLHIIQKWVGHIPGSSVTAKVYTHTRTIAEEDSIKKLNSNSTQL